MGRAGRSRRPLSGECKIFLLSRFGFLFFGKEIAELMKDDGVQKQEQELDLDPEKAAALYVLCSFVCLIFACFFFLFKLSLLPLQRKTRSPLANAFFSPHILAGNVNNTPDPMVTMTLFNRKT